MFKLGKIELNHYPLLLAPMEDVTDPVFRFFCKKYGADIMYSEFVSSDGLAHNNKKTANKLKIFDYEKIMPKLHQLNQMEQQIKQIMVG